MDARFERPIPVEAKADGVLLVDGKPAAWDSLGDSLREAIRARMLPQGTRPSATVRVEVGCPEGTSSRLFDALVGAGVKEILFGGSQG